MLFFFKSSLRFFYSYSWLTLTKKNNIFRIETVSWMLDHGADINILSSEGQNVLHVAATASSGDLIKILWETKKCETMINQTDSNGYTPAYVALINACLSNCQTLRGFGKDEENLKKNNVEKFFFKHFWQLWKSAFFIAIFFLIIEHQYFQVVEYNRPIQLRWRIRL